MLLHLPPMEGHGQPPGQERPRRRPRRRGGPDAIASAIITLPAQLRRSLTWDQGAEMAPRPAAHRHRHRDLLLRPAQPLAAGHQREHQRPAAPVLPQGHRPEPPQPRRPGRRRRRAQRPPPQDARLEDPGRGAGRVPGRRRRPDKGEGRLAPPLSSRSRVPQPTGPPLRPQGCLRHRLTRRPCGPALTPETTAAPGRQHQGPGQQPAPGGTRHPARSRSPCMVGTERVIYRHCCDDPLNPRHWTSHSGC